jgi:hypothetical protein
MSLRNTGVVGALLLLVLVLTVGPALAPRDAGAAGGGGGKDRETVADLKKRVARLEAEVAELRKALLRTGVVKIDPATEVKNVRTIAGLRVADLLQRARNVHAILREIRGGKVVGRALLVRINDLNNDLGTLWLKMASYGLGRDPYLDSIQFDSSGFSRPALPPDHGIPGPYPVLGMPRLYERLLEATGVKGKAAKQKRAEFTKLVRPYANPGVYPHRAFYERAYREYRDGRSLFTPRYGADLKALDGWLLDLEIALGKVPAFFERAP